jgi:hypothetical protein
MKKNRIFPSRLTLVIGFFTLVFLLTACTIKQKKLRQTASSDSAQVTRLHSQLMGAPDMVRLKEIADGNTTGDLSSIRLYLVHLCEHLSANSHPDENSLCNRLTYDDNNSRRYMSQLAQVLYETKLQDKLKFAETLSNLHEKIIACAPSSRQILHGNQSSCQTEVICQGQAAVEINQYIKEHFTDRAYNAYGIRELNDTEKLIGGIDITTFSNLEGLYRLRNYPLFDFRNETSMTYPTEDTEELQQYLENRQFIELLQRWQRGGLRVGSIQEVSAAGSGDYLPVGVMSLRVYKCEKISVIENSATTSETHTCYFGLSDQFRSTNDEQRIVIKSNCETSR